MGGPPSQEMPPDLELEYHEFQAADERTSDDAWSAGVTNQDDLPNNRWGMVQRIGYPTPEAISKADKKGAFLIRAMRATNKEAGALFDPPRATAQADPALAQVDPASEYFIHEEPEENSDLQIVENEMCRFGLVPSFLRFNRWKLRADSDAQWTTVLDPGQGVIAATNNVSPRYVLTTGTPLPQLSNWSDVAFIQYANACRAYEASTGHPASKLEFVLQRYIINMRSRQLIAEVVRRSQARLSAKDVHFTVQADSPEGRLLLASPNGHGVAYLLIQHKDQLGHRIVDSITIDALVAADGEGCSMIFHIREVGAEEAASRDADE